MKHNRSKTDLRKEVEAMRKQLCLPGQGDVNKMPLNSLKKEAAMLRYFITIETNQGPTMSQKLIENGIDLPHADSMTDSELTKKLWQVIYGLADLKHYISKTDHLSERELYHFLWSDFLNNLTFDMGEGLGIVCQEHEIIDSQSIDYLKYYGSEFDLEIFQSDYPDEKPPEQVDLPFDRDTQLPTRLDQPD